MIAPPDAKTGRSAELVVALDVSTVEEAFVATRALAGLPLWLKVGLELFTSAGPDCVRDLVEGGHKVFLDLKFHDIPNTVHHAVTNAVLSGAGMLTLHASGGRAMMEAAVKGKEAAHARLVVANPKAPMPVLLGVTLLTSAGVDEVAGGDVTACVVSRALLAKESGLDGVVCSGHEAAAVKRACGPSFLCLCPGIRFAGGSVDDQARVMSPEQAVQAGADFFVMGRPVMRAENPRKAAEKALNLIQ